MIACQMVLVWILDNVSLTFGMRIRPTYPFLKLSCGLYIVSQC
jgi:uncharacterized membrane protein